MRAVVKGALSGFAIPWVAVGCVLLYVTTKDNVNGLEGFWFFPLTFVSSAVAAGLTVRKAGDFVALCGGEVIAGLTFAALVGGGFIAISVSVLMLAVSGGVLGVVTYLLWRRARSSWLEFQRQATRL